VNIKNNN